MTSPLTPLWLDLAPSGTAFTPPANEARSSYSGPRLVSAADWNDQELGVAVGGERELDRSSEGQTSPRRLQCSR